MLPSLFPPFPLQFTLPSDSFPLLDTAQLGFARGQLSYRGASPRRCQF